MNCIRINIRQATLILLTFLANSVHHSQMADNRMDTDTKQLYRIKNGATATVALVDVDSIAATRIPTTLPSAEKCSAENCKDLDLSNHKCKYGEEITVRCANKPQCKTSSRTMVCRYCYQTDPWEHSCELKGQCNSVSSPRVTYLTNCTVNENILCFGARTFNKNVKCNWSVGYRWTTALALSVTLGGFGADRFYLGHWQEGIGKLFSFGGLGVWTLIDVILISLHYLGPADGSLYI